MFVCVMYIFVCMSVVAVCNGTAFLHLYVSDVLVEFIITFRTREKIINLLFFSNYQNIKQRYQQIFDFYFLVRTQGEFSTAPVWKKLVPAHVFCKGASTVNFLL